MHLFCVYVVLCVGCGLAIGWSLVQGILPTVYSCTLRNWNSGQGPKGCKAIERKKIKFSLCLINQTTRHRNIWRSGGIAPSFLISAVHGSELSASHTGRFTPREIIPSAHWIEGLVSPEPVWTLWSRESLFSLPTTVPRPVAIPTELSRKLTSINAQLRNGGAVPPFPHVSSWYGA
jgi:hypothetical protein